jgi:nicotinamide-nucleotide amidase
VLAPDTDEGTTPEATDDSWVQRIAGSAQGTGQTVALAESLTSGRVAALLGAGEGASTWFRGAVVAYAEEVKFDLLGVTPGPVVTETCARQMAEGVRRLLGADVGLGLTGVGGPGEQEGKPAGTVHLAVATSEGTLARELRLDGDPEQVIAEATTLSLREVAGALAG